MDPHLREWLEEPAGAGTRSGSYRPPRSPRYGREMVYLAARPTHGTKVVVSDEQELADVRWVDLDQADELMGGAMFEAVRSYLEKTLKAQDAT
jgi:hypothetical protein